MRLRVFVLEELSFGFSHAIHIFEKKKVEDVIQTFA